MKNEKRKKEQRTSFGIIPVFRGENGDYTIVVKNPKSKHWGLPKGSPEKGEEPMAVALRELEEETGIRESDIEIKDQITHKETYDFDQGGITYHKINTYWVGFVTEMIIGENLDVDEAKWVKIGEVKDILTHDEPKKVIEEVIGYLG